MKLSKPLQTQQMAPLPPRLEKQLRKAAKMYEQQFLGEMIKAMRSTVTESDLTKPNMAERIYKDQLFDQYAEKWVNNGGNGLADVIYNEIREKLLPQKMRRYQPQPAPSHPSVGQESGPGREAKGEKVMKAGPVPSSKKD